MRKAMELCIVTQTTGEQLVHWLRARCVYKMCIVCCVCVTMRPRVVHVYIHVDCWVGHSECVF